MIRFRLTGGLGNQLFQYAASKALALRLNTDLIYSRDSFDSTRARSDRPLLLEHFVSRSPAYIRSGSISALVIKAFNKIFSKPGKVTHWSGVAYWTDLPNYCAEFERIKDGTFVHGFFQSERYFSSIRDSLIEELRNGMKAELVAAHARLQALGTCPTVAIHIRRGDYSDISVEGGLVVDLSRVRAAAQRFSADHQFMVFSDDPEYASNIDIGVPFQTFQSSVIEEFATMCACDHFIIANSTFSWWASYLGSNPGKRVLAPRNWERPNLAADLPRSDIYLDSHELY